MYNGKAILLTLIVYQLGLNINMTISEGEVLIKNNPSILDNLSLKELYYRVLSLKDEHLSEVLGFLVVNYYKMFPQDNEFYNSFKDGDLQKVYDLIVKSPRFFNELIWRFYEFLRAGKYPETSQEEHYQILNIEVATGAANILIVDSFLANIFDYLFEALEKSNDFSLAASFLAKVIFQDAPYKTSADISYEVGILRSYYIYLFKMLHAEVYAEVSNGLLSLDSNFEETFIRVLTNQFHETLSTEYLVSLVKYYFLARRISKNNKLPDDIIQEARHIDPLFNESR